MKDITKIFKNEATKLIENIQGALLSLENDPVNLELINEVFRVMHTLKGTSGMFGFNNIEKLTHEMETVYDLARDKKLILDSTIIDLTLKLSDRINEIILNNIKELETVDFSNIEFIESIRKNKGTNYNKKTNNLQKDIQYKSSYYIRFRVDDQLLFRGISLLNIFKDLSSIGDYKIISPNFIKANLKTDWGIYLVTKEKKESIEDVLLFVLDNCEIIKIADFNIFDHESIKEILSNNRNNSEKDNNSKTILQQIEELSKNVSDNEINIRNNDIFEQKTTSTSDFKKNNQTINVNAEKLDRLMNLVSELITSSAILNQAFTDNNNSRIQNVAEQIEKLSLQFREVALDVRLIPIRELSVRFQRMVRDISSELGKKVQFIIEGEETELDKNIINNLTEPIMHILRNAIDHGIEDADQRKESGKNEEGVIKMTAFYSGTNVYINIYDDGAGIDTEKVKTKAIEKNLISKDKVLNNKEICNLIMQPGFSTAQKLTSVSGRGVGLDIVQKKIESMQGEIEVDTKPGLGTSFTIKLNQTISIVDTLLVRSGDIHFLIPQNEIEVCIQRNSSELIEGINDWIKNENNVFPWINTRSLFRLQGELPVEQKLIVVNKNKQRFAISADKIVGQHHAVLKPLGELFNKKDFISGTSILGNGTLAFMLDLIKLKEIAILKQREDINGHQQAG